MKRYDLRYLKEDIIPRMIQIMDSEIMDGENGIFLFEIGDFSAIQGIADMTKQKKWTLMNSLKYNEVDWTVVIKKEQPELDELVDQDTQSTKE